MKKPGKIAQAILDEVVPDSREPDSDEDETRAKIVGDEVKIQNSTSLHIIDILLLVGCLWFI